MIQLASETFAASHDPMQLDVNEEVINKLIRLHPSSVIEKTEEEGPVMWILLIPTTDNLMKQFIDGHISETELLNQTPLDRKYTAIYLCSAMVLPEFRRKGLVLESTHKAIENIRTTHPIKTLFVWPFTVEGKQLAEKISKEAGLPLLERS